MFLSTKILLAIFKSGELNWVRKKQTYPEEGVMGALIVFGHTSSCKEEYSWEEQLRSDRNCSSVIELILERILLKISAEDLLKS